MASVSSKLTREAVRPSDRNDTFCEAANKVLKKLEPLTATFIG